MSTAAISRAFGAQFSRIAAVAIGLVVLVSLPPLALVNQARADTSTMLPGLKLKPGEQMLVEADQIIYDYDNNQVSAVGNVQIYYSGNTLEAEKVTYVKSTGRLLAAGHVKLTDASGIAIYAEQLDITDSFKDGFVQSLRVETPDHTHFAAEHAERANGETTTFVNSVYTACEPCKDHPEKPPFWQVKAQTIVFNHKEKMVYFHHAALEFFGRPIAWFPYFSTPDPSVKRKSGFLSPTMAYTPKLGFGIGIPYFWDLAPNYDLTVTPTYYTRQGLLSEAEWRHRLENGQYTLKMAGIEQHDPGAFLSGPYGTYAQRDFRGGIRTTGEFYLNEDWTLGWDGTLSTDRMFTRDYSVLNTDTAETISSVHLTGLKDRNYFDARAYYFQVLTDLPSAHQYDQNRQAIVAPVVDHEYIFDDPVMGGELSINSNLTALNREKDDPFVSDGNTYYHGLAGTYVRGTTEASWQRRIVTDNGQVFTPFASARGDIYSLNPDGSAAAITGDPTAYRFMPAVGLEWNWPILATLGTSSHIFEPIVQVIARPDATLVGELPNDAAQRLVFDDTNLFSRDKFSGFDRVEGGTRLNAGLHYLGTFDNGASIDALVGQSYQLAGTNPFTPDAISNVGAYSGLDTNVSDYVGRVALTNGLGTSLTARGRFGSKDFTAHRVEIAASNVTGILTTSVAYQYLLNDPHAGGGQTSAASGTASVAFAENWSLFGALAYDLNKQAIGSDSFGVAYTNSCVTISAAYAETRLPYTDNPQSQKLLVKLQLRTLGGGSASADLKGVLN